MNNDRTAPMRKVRAIKKAKEPTMVTRNALVSICVLAQKPKLEALDQERILYLALRGLQELPSKG